MHTIFSPKARKQMAGVLLFLLFAAMMSPAQRTSRQPGNSAASSTEQRTARYFESIRKSPPQQWAFLLQMPKGGDLHNHLSGAVYAESYIQFAAEAGLCVDLETMALLWPPPGARCENSADSQQPPVSFALRNQVIYNKMIDAWSMRNSHLSGQSGHDHFFDTFAKFGPATFGQTGKMLAEAVSNAARGRLLYVEFMLTPDGTATGVLSSEIGAKVGWDGNFESTLNKFKAAGIDSAAALAIKNLRDAEAEKDRLLKCGTTNADPGCSVTIRYVAQVSRGAQLGPVFAQMVTGFALANNPNSKVVALNLVQAEDGLVSMQNFSLHMQMLQFLRPMYPKAHLSLHAGELAPGLVPQEGLTFHVRDSVMTAGANRIGHGVDIMHETDPYELLKEMARRRVIVEICLSSNDLILGVRGRQHPLATYMQYGVPVALATDDEGVARSEISREYLKAVEEQGLSYLQLKAIARNSLEYAFISGGSLWSEARKFTVIAQCRQDLVFMKLTLAACKQFVENSEKAKLQFRLEQQFREFETAYNADLKKRTRF